MKRFQAYPTARLRSHAVEALWIVGISICGHGCLAQTITHGTFYAVERTPRNVAVAIDSSLAVLDTRNNPRAQYSVPHAVCKIHASAGKVFVIAGDGSFTARKKKDVRYDFQVSEIVGTVLSENPPQSRILPILESKLIPHFVQILSNNNTARTYWKDGASVVQVVIAGADSGVPFIRGLQLIVHYEGGTVKIVPQEVVDLGSPDFAEDQSLVTKPPSLHVTGNAVLDVETRLQKELSSGNKDLLAPMQVVTMSSDGRFEWVSKPDFCPMIPRY